MFVTQKRMVQYMAQTQTDVHTHKHTVSLISGNNLARFFTFLIVGKENAVLSPRSNGWRKESKITTMDGKRSKKVLIIEDATKAEIE